MAVDYVTIKIGGSGGTALPLPSSMKISYEDLDSDDSKRYVTTGVMRRKRVRSNVMKVTLTYPVRAISEIENIIPLVSSETYQAYLYSPKDGSYVTKTFYSNEKSFEYKRMARGIMADSFTFTMTEV